MARILNKSRTRLAIVVSLAVATFWPSRTSADELDHWIWRNPRPFCSQVNCVAQGDGLWLVFANAGMLATSLDGVEWDLANIGTNAILSAGAAGNGRCVVASSRGVYWSSDAHNWTKALPGVSLNDVAFGNGLFVGVGGSSVFRSVTGTNWASTALGVINTFDRISFANGKFFAMGVDSISQGLVYFSSDGTNWTGPVGLATNRLQRIAGGNGVYVGINQTIAGTNFSSQIRTSTNGSTWSTAVNFDSHLLADIVFANGSFFALDQIGRVMVSTDGIAWTEYSAPELFAVGRVAWNGSLFVASGLLGNIVSSTDGVHWTKRTLGPGNSIAGAIHASGLYVGVTGTLVPGGGDTYSKSTVVTSSNGRDWSEHDSGTTNSLIGVAAGNARYVGVGNNGTIITSTDASTWSSVASPATNVLYAASYGAGRFAVVGGVTNRAAILGSTDGINWAAQSDASNYFGLFALTFAQNQFVAVGQLTASKQATTLTSTDGLVWTPRTSGATNHLRGITWGSNGFVAVGDKGSITISSDGITWTNVSLSTVINLRCVAYGNGYYVVAGYPSTLFVSTNGVNWSIRSAYTLVTTQPVYAAVWGDDSFIFTGYFGQVLESALFHPPAPQFSLKLRSCARPFLSLTGPEAHGIEIQSSDTWPPSWQTLTTCTNLSPTTFLPDTCGTNLPGRFYRARVLN